MADANGWYTGYRTPVQPEDLAGLRRVADAVAIPVAAGERVYTRYDARALLDTGAVAVFQADPLHTGGILETKKMIAMAELASAQVALHNSNGPVCSAVALHLHLRRAEPAPAGKLRRLRRGPRAGLRARPPAAARCTSTSGPRTGTGAMFESPFRNDA